MKKTYEEKLNNSYDMPKIVTIDAANKNAKKFGCGKMLIAPPLEYYDLMGKIPKGFLATSELLRKTLAKKHGADFTCPLTGGIFINICAWASFEREDNQIPYWRTLKKDGELNEKYPDGIEGQKFMLENEGFIIVQKGKRYFVKEFEKHLYDFR